MNEIKCGICKTPKPVRVLDLGHQAPSDAFVNEVDLQKPEVSYPLGLYFCTSCSLVQLGYVVDPVILFKDYVYTSGMNNSLIENFKNLVSTCVKKFQLTSADLAVDIGSNDGTLLSNYHTHGVKTLGIDPSSATTFAIKKGITTIVDFFNESTAEHAVKKYGKAKIVTATNVFAHVPDLTSFVRGIKKMLTRDGVFISESGYLLDLVEKIQYDSIYHEHLRYYSLHSLATLFKKFGFEVFDVERINTHNGSIRVYAARVGVYKKSSAVDSLLSLEKRHGLHSIKTMYEFAKKVSIHRLALQELLLNLKKEGKTIVGIGAPAKGNTLLNSCRLSTQMIDYLVEKSELKIGLYSPGMHIPVVSEKNLFKLQPEYGLVLSWNIADELIKKLKDKGFKGRFILPFPKPRIV